MANNLPQGYKQTELGIIPEDWDVKILGDIGTFSKGSGVSRTESNTGNIPCVRYGELYTHHNDYIKMFNSFISSEVAKNAKMIKCGDVLFAASGETKEDIGKSVAFVGNFEAYAGGDIIILSTNALSCDAKYIGYASNSIQVIKQKAAKAQGDAVVHITSDSIKNIKISIPPLPEQKAIAEALSDVDELIAALDKKIAKKRLIKQGAMQELLTGKKRLPGFEEEWVVKKLGDIGVLLNGYAFKSETYNKAGKYNIITIANVQNGKLTINDCNRILSIPSDIQEHQKLKKNDILISMTGNVGRACLVNASDCLLNQRVGLLVIRDTQNCDKHFIFTIINDGKFENAMIESGQGAAQANIGKKDIEGFTFLLPTNIKEQQAIATILSDMDKEIADLEAQRDKYRLVKYGMMQKLLTGEIRLKKPQASQILESKAIPVDAHIMAGHIVNRLYKSEGWGRTKLQKSLHLVGYYAQIYIGNEYIRNTAGPDDQRLMNYIDQQFRQFNHVKITRVKSKNGKIHYNYTPTSLIHEVEMAYAKYPENVRKQIDLLLDKMNVMDLDCAEILSTLYGVWNNRIIKGESITDDLLIADFYAWSKHKLDFEETRLRRALNYMRKENIIPTGWGKYIDKR